MKKIENVIYKDVKNSEDRIKIVVTKIYENFIIDVYFRGVRIDNDFVNETEFYDVIEKYDDLYVNENILRFNGERIKITTIGEFFFISNGYKTIESTAFLDSTSFDIDYVIRGYEGILEIMEALDGSRC